MSRVIAAVMGVAAVFSTFALGAPSVAKAARQAVCEHPEGSYCTAKKDTGRITCQCLDGEHELQDPELPMSSDDELMDACWEAWSQTCGSWGKQEAECEEPDLGGCEVNDEGEVLCTCADGSEEEDLVSTLEGLDADALEDSCYEQLDRLCAPPEPEPVMAPEAPVQSSAPTTTCAVEPHGRAPWLLLPPLALGIARRRRRRRAA